MKNIPQTFNHYNIVSSKPLNFAGNNLIEPWGILSHSTNFAEDRNLQAQKRLIINSVAAPAFSKEQGQQQSLRFYDRASTLPLRGGSGGIYYPRKIFGFLLYCRRVLVFLKQEMWLQQFSHIVYYDLIFQLRSRRGASPNPCLLPWNCGR